MSGTIPPDVQHTVDAGTRPRADYLQLAAALGADLVDVPTARERTGRTGRWLERVGGEGALLAWYSFRARNRYGLVVTDSEHVAFPLAALCRLVRRRPRHVVIAHRLSPSKKRIVHQLLGLRRRIDGVVVYSTPQYRFAIERLGYDPACVLLTTFMVDTSFWHRAHTAAAPRTRPLVVAVGQELRDYPTMIAAVRELDVDVVLAAASPWSRRRDSSAGIKLPANVTVSSFDQRALRDLYGAATVVVVPLVETDFQAGITTILEAMSMERALICTRTSGQSDTVVDGVTGVYVPPGDVAALRDAITRVVASPAADEMVAEARAWVVAQADIVPYAARIAAFALAADA